MEILITIFEFLQSIHAFIFVFTYKIISDYLCKRCLSFRANSKKISVSKDNLTLFLCDILLISNLIDYDFKAFIFILSFLLSSVKYKILIQNLIICYPVGTIIGALLFIWTKLRMKHLFLTALFEYMLSSLTFAGKRASIQ